MSRKSWFKEQFRKLKDMGYGVEAAEDMSWVILSGMELRGRGWTDANGRRMRYFSSHIGIPPDFPMSYPGMEHAHSKYSIHVPLILYNGKALTGLIGCNHRPWHWMCFSSIPAWDPKRDDLCTIAHIINNSVYGRRR